ncbi:MAG: Nramp family divalent metal transporter [Haliscomenobacter sp.]|uniref:Nramp family divalent metal transporter n=1 Tax=Haliscomenobacter sp. TaxID=2717303 RepID=UPI0029BE0880|nr:Nramp family divalent metal transporter [Haliscomenobacter sp.]MDX2070594.1 Nramp family divalent metal transporter [Haliscomenobacter sp.]
MSDPYVLRLDAVQTPPVSFWQRLQHLGPGFVLSAAIVGSGELIATTALGAKAGFVAFWVILVSCLVKVAVQVQFAKHTILTGKTAMQTFDDLPGPRIGKARWTVALYFLIMLIKFVQMGGIIGGVALVLNMLLPQLSVAIWALVMAPMTSVLVFRGYYSVVEKTCLLLITGFTLFAIAALIFLQYTPYGIDWGQLSTGLSFSLPSSAVVYAFGAFGITGIGGEEIIYYNYWCLEKGYARHTGPNDGSAAWAERARGWIKVMQADAVCSMVVYTAVTAVFYLLGAAVLHARQEVPEGYQLLEVLSGIFTESLGPWARIFFMVGAFFVLYSTLFAGLAVWGRLFSDIFSHFGWMDFFDLKQRQRSIGILSWVVPLIWTFLFLSIKLPLFMVLSGGIAGSVLLLLVLYATLYFRYGTTTGKFDASWRFDLVFWVSILAILAVSVYGIYSLNFKAPKKEQKLGLLLNFDQNKAAELDHFIESYQKRYHIPGVSLALIKNGKVAYAQTYGVRNTATQAPVDENTLFEAASITKPVFAFAVLRLVEKGIIDLDKPLYQYLPNKDIEYDERYKLMTARHVLCHRTGFPNWRNQNKDGKLDLKFTPGSEYSYSGEGFEYLKRVVEKITGKGVEQVLREEVIQPLGLYHTYFSKNDTLVKLAATGHFKKRISTDEIPTQPGMAYSMYTEARAFSRFMLALLEQKGLKPETYTEMLSVQSSFPWEEKEKPKYKSHLGLSLFVHESPYGLAFGHQGSNGDFNCNFEVYKEAKMGYVVFTNASTAGPLIRDLGEFLVGGKVD